MLFPAYVQAMPRHSNASSLSIPNADIRVSTAVSTSSQAGRWTSYFLLNIARAVCASKVSVFTNDVLTVQNYPEVVRYIAMPKLLNGPVSLRAVLRDTHSCRFGMKTDLESAFLLKASSRSQCSQADRLYIQRRRQASVMAIAGDGYHLRPLLQIT